MFEPTVIIAGAALVGLTIVASALLRAWHGWLALKREELERVKDRHDSDSGSSIGAARIELADLKERIKKLEAIASGVDL
ncbi:hypothetical protein A3726_05220 [Erythrobacter sp. HI0037]|uniref:hypothetical protein n=1 Tax=Qipengyuania flava TaxID=192812 RepID=UPI0007C20291|nr:hypothetical protein A3719_14345 [Erythrobacter sp. HI0020]KZY19393.1 hypothetical protein A3727_15190 [Erythrobacter sp. HI0038]KZY19878.1 hypothetical protein A3727_26085 [Erythrobacter sp. HI0038]KZY22837.1 hypothetical protein A3726_05220 [Erythrobacter sp. HI0037]